MEKTREERKRGREREKEIWKERKRKIFFSEEYGSMSLMTREKKSLPDDILRRKTLGLLKN